MVPALRDLTCHATGKSSIALAAAQPSTNGSSRMFTADGTTEIKRTKRGVGGVKRRNRPASFYRPPSFKLRLSEYDGTRARKRRYKSLRKRKKHEERYPMGNGPRRGGANGRCCSML